jgi:vancomycin resistance protein YoaR
MFGFFATAPGFNFRPTRPAERCAARTLGIVDAYFTIEAGGRIYKVGDEMLRGGWWNERDRMERYGAKTIWERARESRNFKKDFPDIWRVIKQIARETEVKAFDGNIVFNANAENHADRFTVENARDGFDLDETRLCKDILNALRNEHHETIAAAARVARAKNPALVTARLGLRGGYTTYFESNPNREHNIALALEKFNGLVVPNGQSVSFNQIVGARSAERGFREAKIILDGEFVPGIGGGVCQASTTLFNAAMLAGLTIDKSHNHSLAISYVPVGRDAMVSSATDLVFTNRTGATVYIETGTRDATDAQAGRAFVKIYGNKTNVKYRPRTTVTECELDDGEITPERRASTYVDAFHGEKLVNTTFVRKSRYAAKKDT